MTTLTRTIPPQRQIKYWLASGTLNIEETWTSLKSNRIKAAGPQISVQDQYLSRIWKAKRTVEQNLIGSTYFSRGISNKVTLLAYANTFQRAFPLTQEYTWNKFLKCRVVSCIMQDFLVAFCISLQTWCIFHAEVQHYLYYLVSSNLHY